MRTSITASWRHWSICMWMSMAGCTIQQLPQCWVQLNEKAVFWFVKQLFATSVPSKQIFQTTSWTGICSSDTLPSVLFCQLRVWSQFYLSHNLNPTDLGHTHHSHHSPPPGSVECLSQIHSQSKDSGPTCLCPLPLLSYCDLSRLLLTPSCADSPKHQPHLCSLPILSLNGPVIPCLISSSDTDMYIDHPVPPFRLLSEGFRPTNVLNQIVLLPIQLHLGTSSLEK